MEIKYNAVILNKKDIGEVDRLYVAYAMEAGKISVAGKGVRRQGAKLAGSLEPITLSEIFVAKSRGKGNITGAIVTENFSHIKENYSLLQKVFYVFSAFDKLITQQEGDEKIFSMLLSYLKTMNGIGENDQAAEVLNLGFLFKLLENLGYKLEVEKCVRCGKRLEKEQNYFSISLGGILCQNCGSSERKKVKIEVETIKLIRLFLANRVENIVKVKVSARELGNARLILQETLNWIAA